MTEETSLWKCSPSQWLNLGPITAALIVAGGILFGGLFFPPAFIGLVLPVVYLIWRYLAVRTQIFELTSERLRITRGILNQRIDEIELYRVKDSLIVRPWWMRLTGLASIVIETSDRSMPHHPGHPRRCRTPRTTPQTSRTGARPQAGARTGFRGRRRRGGGVGLMVRPT